MPPRTTKHTLYRLTGVDPANLFDAVDFDQLEQLNGDLASTPRFDRLGVAALIAHGCRVHEEAGWCEEFRRTTGSAVAEPSWRSAGLLVVAVDGEVYAIGYDQGHHLIPDHVKDHDFGLGFALRAVDPDAVSGITSKVLGQGRTDSTTVPGGIPVAMLGFNEYQRIVRKVAGALEGVELTRIRSRKGGVAQADGGRGLLLPLGIDAAELIADIREIARVCREQSPHPALEFVERVRWVRDPTTKATLDDALDALLADPKCGQFSAVVPFDHLESCQRARLFRTRINSADGLESDEFDLEYVLQRAAAHRSGRRWAALRDGKVELYRHRCVQAADRLASVSVTRWLEANLSIGARRFHLSDGRWYEIGERFLPAITAAVENAITSTPSVRLPQWESWQDEGDYNLAAARFLGTGYVCVDKRTVANPLKSRNAVELCDLLTPDGTLVLVKRADRSDALSHLFAQGKVAVSMLLNSAEVRERFARKVAEVAGERIVSDDFVPKRLVFAILLKDGAELSTDTLFGFSQVTLAETVQALGVAGVRVEVVGIEAAAEA